MGWPLGSQALPLEGRENVSEYATSEPSQSTGEEVEDRLIEGLLGSRL